MLGVRDEVMKGTAMGHPVGICVGKRVQPKQQRVGYVCPCGGLVDRNVIGLSDRSASVNVVCPRCRKEWIETYELVRQEECPVDVAG